MNLNHTITPNAEIDSKWLKPLNIRHDTIKLQKEIIGKAFSDINSIDVFLGESSKAIEIKTKINKWDLLKLNKLLHSKGNHKQNKKTTYRIGENIYQQGFNFKNIQTHTIQQQQKQLIQAEDLTRHFSKENVRMANKYIKRCSKSLIREMQIKTTKSYQITPVRMAIIKCWRGCKEKGNFLSCWWEHKFVQPL